VFIVAHVHLNRIFRPVGVAAKIAYSLAHISSSVHLSTCIRAGLAGRFSVIFDNGGVFENFLRK
jgi:hypothetical protein